jgi:hypothetical protein
MKVYEGNVRFSDITSHGLVVDFGKPWRLVFWREAQYAPCWDIDGVWGLAAEWFETIGSESPYDYEPISDKQGKYTRPRVVEFGPARAVIHWHYALCDSTKQAQIFNGNTTADEYYYVYPDGFATRKLVGWPGDLNNFGGQPLLWETAELDVVNPKGSTCFQNLRRDVALLSNIEGDEYRLTWSNDEVVMTGQEAHDVVEGLLGKSLCIVHPQSCTWSEYIIKVNLSDRPGFFLMFPNDQQHFPHAPCQQGCKHNDHPTIQLWSAFHAWKCWPAYHHEYHIAISASEADMMSKCCCTAIVSIDPYLHAEAGKRRPTAQHGIWRPNRPSTWVFLVGVSSATDGFLRVLARSWLRPAEILDCPCYDRYDLGERAYVFRDTGQRLEFLMRSSHEIVNPVFVLGGWETPGASVKFNGTDLDSSEFAVSWQSDQLIVWINGSVRQDTRVAIAAG